MELQGPREMVDQPDLQVKTYEFVGPGFKGQCAYCCKRGVVHLWQRAHAPDRYACNDCIGYMRKVYT